MTQYVTQDGMRFKASRSRKVVDALRAQSFREQAGSRKQWRELAAHRANGATGKAVRHDNDVNFVHDLIEVGLLKKELGNG